MSLYLNSELTTGFPIVPPVWDATGALKTDDYDNDAGLLEIDFHLEFDSAGSRTEYAK